MVRSGVVVRAWVKLRAFTAPVIAVRLAACAVAVRFWGRVRTPSMTWTTPPVKLMLVCETETLLFRPEKNVTLPLTREHSTTCPPVTLA